MVFFKQMRRLSYLIVLIVFAIIDISRSGLTRHTFEFFAFDDKRPVVEDRMLYKSGSLEADIRSYIEELIMGPVSVDLAPLVNRGTTLRAIMFREGTVYADLSRDAVHPVLGGRPLFDGFLVINQGIRRNFDSVSDVKLFIHGNEVFFEEFEQIFRLE